jgi:homoserine dehydrogenase
MGKRTVKVGLIGMGTIGGSVAGLLLHNLDRINAKSDLDLVLERVADRDEGKLKSLALPAEKLLADAFELVRDPQIDIVIELIGGIEPARSLIKEALENGKFVVTANKDLIATHGEELLELARRKNLNIFYEASVGGGIPLIRPLKYSLIADRLKRVVGILNGTTNYILTCMSQEGLGFEEALALARENGFAEADPSSDVEGRDASYKLMILAGLAFGKVIDPARVYVEGITGITAGDINYAREIDCVIKLLAIGEELPEGIALRVHPAMIPHSHPLASVNNEFNAVFIEGEAVGDVMFYGRGAGGNPTATAVLSDLVEAARCISGQSVCSMVEKHAPGTKYVPIEQLSSRFYLRFLAEDRPGVLAAFSKVFGDHLVSLDMVIQKRRVEELAEIVLVTHLVREDAFRKALDQVMKLEMIRPNPSTIRLMV